MRTSTHAVLTARAFVAAAVCLTFCRTGRAQAIYSIKDLGPFPNAQGIAPSALSDSGTVVGRIDTPTGTLPFQWQGDAIRQLQVPALWPHGLATAVNGNGEVVGTLTDPSGIVEQPAYWNGGAPVLLSLQDYVGGSPVAINDAGRIVGWLYRNQEILSVYWEGGVPHPLDTPPGVSDCLPSAINNHGDVVFWQGNGSAASAFVYRNASWTTISPLPGDPELYAGAINNNGDVVGTSGDFTFDRLHAFLFHGGQVQPLIPLELGMRSSASSINDAGQAVGTANGHAYLFTAATYQDLNTLIPQDSGWELLAAAAINNKGQIVGTGIHDGQSRAFLLTPTSVEINEDAAKLHFQERTDSGADVLGIVCDNLAWPEAQNPDALDEEFYDRLVLRLPDFAQNGIAPTITDYSPKEGDPTSQGVLKLSADGSRLVYYPPVEFNEDLTPAGESDITKAATRQVVLTIHFTTADQQRHVIRRPVVLARTPVILVHGINNPPSVWWPLVYRLDGGDQLPDGQNNYVPFVRVNHYSDASYPETYNGNGAVERAALEVQRAISDTLSRVRNGRPLPQGAVGWYWELKFDPGLASPVLTYVPDWADFTAYTNTALAIRRVDVVAWSYGGAITRWYIASPNAPDSYGWYRWSMKLPADRTLPTYQHDIRKMISVGSMWRGVPLCNYANEAWFAPSSSGWNLAQGPAATIPGVDYTVANVAELLSALATPLFPDVRTDVPSMEVMAVDSPWMQWLVYRGSDHAQPFDDHIAYGSAAGDNQRYLGLPGGGYGTIDVLQQPSWFPFLALEVRQDSGPAYSDGIVPVWSSAIPDKWGRAFITVPATHNGYAKNPETQQYVLRKLNDATLPLGTVLSDAWRRTTELDLDERRHWTFSPDKMAPVDQSRLYGSYPGAVEPAGASVQWIGRLNPNALGPRSIGTVSLSNITKDGFTVSWRTVIGMNAATLRLYRRRNGQTELLTTKPLKEPTTPLEHTWSISYPLQTGTSYEVEVDSELIRDPDKAILVTSERTAFELLPAIRLEIRLAYGPDFRPRVYKVPGGVAVDLTVSNTGSSVAKGVTFVTARLGSQAATAPLPLIGDIAPGSGKLATLVFAAPGFPGTSVPLHVSVRLDQGGEASGTWQIVLP